MIATMRPGSTPTSPSRKLGPAARRFAPPALFLAAVLLSSLVAQAAAPAGSAVPVPEAASSAATAHPPRLVSLNPSLTAIVARLGAAQTLVGVDDYSARVEPELADRPRVGGLFDPSLEAVMALRPDRVLIVAGLEQESHGAALRRLGLEVEIFENERYEQVLANIERIGRLVGREAKAEERITAIRALRAAVERAVAGRPRPRTVIVLDRSPLYLVGGETFLDELLRAVGATNLGAEVARGYPRGSLEWLVAAGPELVLDLSPQAEAAAESAGALAFWSRWPSLPAVKAGRVLALDATRVSLPGPDLDRALRDLAVAVHGAPIESAIAGELAAGRGAP
jgi:iron complex transport system substrate-binding protein